MNIVVNGSARELAEGASLADAVEQVTSAPRGIAVAVNGSVVPRREWAARRLTDSDRVEILTAVQGG